MKVTETKIKSLPIWKDILDIGCEEIIPWKRTPNNTIKIDHDILGIHQTRSLSGHNKEVKGNLTLFSSGYLRFYSDRPNRILDAIRGNRKHIMSLSEWEARLIKVFDFVFQAIVTDEENGMGFEESIFDSVSRKYKSLPGKIIWLLKEDREKVFKWIETLEEEKRKPLLKILEGEIKEMLEEEPGKTIISMKGLWRDGEVKRMVDNLDDSLKKEIRSSLGLVGGLRELGF